MRKQVGGGHISDLQDPTHIMTLGLTVKLKKTWSRSHSSLNASPLSSRVPACVADTAALANRIQPDRYVGSLLLLTMLGSTAAAAVAPLGLS